MPAEFYDFKATPAQMSFGEQIFDITTIERINQSFDYVIRLLPTLTEKQLSETKFTVNFEGRPAPDINGRDMVMNMFVHAAHHRAQCEVYLRLKGNAETKPKNPS